MTVEPHFYVGTKGRVNAPCLRCGAIPGHPLHIRPSDMERRDEIARQSWERAQREKDAMRRDEATVATIYGRPDPA
jgi:hypothetical protein